MSELRRLLDGQGDEIEQALLDSAVHDGPSKRAGQKTLAALGIGGGLVASGTSAATASAATGAAQAAAATGGKAGIGVLVKWVGIATVGGVATLGVAQQVGQSDPPPQTAMVTIAPVAQQAQSAARAVTPDTLDSRQPAALVDSEEGGDESPATPERADRTAKAARGGGGGGARLGAEVKRLDQARVAMQGGQPAAALSAIEAYEREFPAGVLAPEAQVLRIQALSQAGRTSEARQLAQAFLARHPDSPHARRVRSLIGETAGSPSR